VTVAPAALMVVVDDTAPVYTTSPMKVELAAERQPATPQLLTVAMLTARAVGPRMRLLPALPFWTIEVARPLGKLMPLMTMLQSQSKALYAQGGLAQLVTLW
jgi:hypothetical protein